MLVCAFATTAQGAAAENYADKSLVTLPRTVGKFRFVSASFDPAKPLAGVSAIYSYPGAPSELLLQLDVVPAGPVREDQFVKTAADMLAKAMQRLPGVQSMRVDKQYPWSVPKPHSFWVKGVEPGETDPKPSRGISQNFNAIYQGKPTLIQATTYYRHMFLIRVSVTGTEGATDYGDLIGTLNRALVPAIDIRNFGACGDLKKLMPMTEGAKRNDEVAAFLQAKEYVLAYNCARSEADPPVPPPAGERYTLVYPETPSAK
jgi:hypothetical protein